MKEVSLKNIIYIIDRLHHLVSQLHDEATPNRFLALFDLTRKMRTCMDALIPLEKYDILCVPVNLLYRCMISDLMTSLLITKVDDYVFNQVMHIMDIDYTKSLLKSINAETIVKTSLYPESTASLQEYSLSYQNQHFDEFADCLQSVKGEPWKVQSKKAIQINGVGFDGSIDKMYKVLLTFEDVKNIAYIYRLYKIFSQSEHFSLRNRVFNYKQEFHETYYNQARGLIYLGEELIYNTYSNYDTRTIP